MNIAFATSNHGKVETMRHHFRQFGISEELEMISLEIDEIQADTSEQVAMRKALDAYRQINRPVLVDDSSFHIDALNGFPGVYAKFANETIGAEGIVKLLDGIENRHAWFQSTLVFVDKAGMPHVFRDTPFRGIIANTVDDFDAKKAWSPLYKIIIPDGSDKVLGRMTLSDHTALEQTEDDSYKQFCEWLITSAK